MAHTYATVADFNSYRLDQGDSVLGNTGEATIRVRRGVLRRPV